MIKICHFSDWHGKWVKLPEADLYICTGDMLPNFFLRKRGIVNSIFEEGQLDWIKNRPFPFRSFLGSPDAPVVVVRGNHDFINLGPHFGGEYFEVNLDSHRSVEYCGLKIGGFRGINPLSGRWCDEFSQRTRLGMLACLPEDLDVVVSHVPPKGILAWAWGCEEYAWQVTRWEDGTDTAPKLCCFGHIHESGGKTQEGDGILFSNASCTYNEIELLLT